MYDLFIGNSPAELVMFTVDELELSAGAGVPGKMYSLSEGRLSNAEMGVCKFFESTSLGFRRNSSLTRNVSSSEKLPSSKTKRNSHPSSSA